MMMMATTSTSFESLSVSLKDILPPPPPPSSSSSSVVISVSPASTLKHLLTVKGLHFVLPQIMPAHVIVVASCCCCCCSFVDFERNKLNLVVIGTSYTQVFQCTCN